VLRSATSVVCDENFRSFLLQCRSKSKNREETVQFEACAEWKGGDGSWLVLSRVYRVGGGRWVMGGGGEGRVDGGGGRIITACENMSQGRKK
jgi:hypothetical protein